MGRASALPVGLQLIGAWWEEAKLLRLACALEDGQDKGRRACTAAALL
jgi:Asp-tRNA(Asn)/Glu-tRNA(Gln) amidotransferase A subunit family amidase